MVTICTTSFNTHKFYVLPTQCIYVFRVDLRKKTIISVYNINLSVFITEADSVYYAVRTGSLSKTLSKATILCFY